MSKQVVLIMADTVRQDMLSCYEPTSARTPNMDSIGQEGARFDNAFTTQPVCGPARSGIFTGQYPHTNGMIANCMQLGQNIKNAAEWLRPEGIECGYVGKWHLDGGDYFGYGKCPEGYNPEYWYDMRNFLDELTPEERKLSRKNIRVRVGDIKPEDTYAHRCTDRAVKFIEEFKDKDFFLTLSFDEPHDPSLCPKKYFAQLKRERFKFHKLPNVKASLEGKPAHQKVWADSLKGLTFKMATAGFRGVIACNLFLDDEIGRVLQKIKECGLDPMIIYTSDHGDMVLSHGIMNKGCVMYNENIRIPMLIKGGGFTQGEVKTPVSHIDLLPTIMKHLGVKIPRMLQGEPLQGIAKDVQRDVFIEFTRYEVDHDAFMGYQPIRCIFDGRYKFVINLMTSDELYDLDTDPYEMRNLILSEEHISIRNELHERLINQMNETRDVYRGYYWHCRPWRKDVKPSIKHTGYTRQLIEEDFVQLDYSTGLPMQGGTRKK